MKSSALLPSNFSRVIDRSNLSPRRFASRRGDFDRSMTRGKLLGNECTAFHFYFLNKGRHTASCV